MAQLARGHDAFPRFVQKKNGNTNLPLQLVPLTKKKCRERQEGKGLIIFAPTHNNLHAMIAVGKLVEEMGVGGWGEKTGRKAGF